MNLRVLVVSSNSDDILFLREVFEDIESGRHWRGWVRIQMLQASSVEHAVSLLSDEPVDAVLLDLSLCGDRAIEGFRHIQSAASQTPVILIADPEETDVAVRLVREGAEDFLMAHLLDAAPLAHSLGNAIERHRLLSAARAACTEDPLTGLLNRAAFLALAGRDRRLAERLSCRWMLLLAEPRDSAPPSRPVLPESADRRDMLALDTADRLRRLTGSADLMGRVGDLRFALGIFETASESVEAAWSRIHSAARGSHIAVGAAIFDRREAATLDGLLEQAERDLTPRALAVRT